MIPKQRLLLSDWFKNHSKDHPIEICDVGAREKLFRPFDSLPEYIYKIHGFEPDAQEAKRLEKKYSKTSRKYYPYGLWSSSTNIDLYYAELAGNSSIHPPNLKELEKCFPKKHWTNRTTEEILKLGVRSLDDVDAEYNFDCDLLKVDTQGSEYEIIQGAEKMLDEKICFVLLETWTFEVHKGQALSGKIMEWMHQKGFTLIRTNNAADWHRKEVDQLNKVGLRTLVGLDLLFVRDDFNFATQEITFKKIVNSAALAELYGFPDLAIQILDQNKAKAPDHQKEINSVKKIIISNWSVSHEGFIFRAIRKLISILGYSIEKHHSDPYAPLH